MGRKIRLTESQFHNMIKRIVKETKHQWDEEIIEDEDFEMDVDVQTKKMSPLRAAKKIADFLTTDVFPNLSSEELSQLKREMPDEVGSSMSEMNENEDFDDLESRRAGRKEKAMIRGGLATAGASAVALLGEFMGYSEFELTNMLHDINHMAGLGEYTGPVGVGIVALGLATALAGLDRRMKRTGK